MASACFGAVHDVARADEDADVDQGRRRGGGEDGVFHTRDWDRHPPPSRATPRDSKRVDLGGRHVRGYDDDDDYRRRRDDDDDRRRRRHDDRDRDRDRRRDRDWERSGRDRDRDRRY